MSDEAVPVCGFEFDGAVCNEVGSHMCAPRVSRVVTFFSEVLVHTKGRYSRKPFILRPWQRDDIVAPMFGRAVWSTEFGDYRRQYEIAWIELGRKNGKSELQAGIMLYLLVADGEESAELYGIARDRDQAALVYEVAARMVQLSSALSRRLRVTAHKKRISDPTTHSFYQVLASDAAGALGSNPHGVAADEILAWRDGSMWDALRTGLGSGARKQPLMVAATTAGNDPEGFAGLEHKEMARIAEEPERAPHIFVYMRNLDQDADPWDEENWKIPNPALGDFLSLDGMRRQALEAKNDPNKENAFRQFKLNQWVKQAFRWMPMHLYDRDVNTSTVWDSAEQGRAFMAGRECWLGLDLAARQDLTALALVFPDNAGGVDVLWRFWMPEAGMLKLDHHNEGKLSKWAQQGWLTVTEGDVLDFDQVYTDIESDASDFTVLGGDADQWSSDPVIQEVAKRTDIQEIYAYKNDFSHMSPGMSWVMDLIKSGRFRHHGNPVARWHFDSVEARTAPYDPDLTRPSKPNRQKESRRIDGVPAVVMAVNAWKNRGEDLVSVYETEDLLVI